MGVDFVFNWPSTTVGITDPNVLCDLVGQGEDHEKVKERVMQSTSGLHAASNVWTDGMILPQDTRKVCVFIYICIYYLWEGISGFKTELLVPDYRCCSQFHFYFLRHI